MVAESIPSLLKSWLRYCSCFGPVAAEIAPEPGVVGIDPHGFPGFLIEYLHQSYSGQFGFTLIIDPDSDDVVLPAGDAQCLFEVFIHEIRYHESDAPFS